MNTINNANLHKIKPILLIIPITSCLIVLGHTIFTMIQRQYSLLSLSLFIYADLMLVQYCNDALQTLPRREKSLRKSLLKFALFLLFSGILFAIVCESAPFCGPLTTGLFYAMAIGGTIFNFYAHMIYDGDGGGENSRDEEAKCAYVCEEV